MRAWYNEWLKEVKGKVLDVGRSTYWEYGFDTIDTNSNLNPTITGDICNSGLPSDEYDYVLCNGLYEGVKDQQRMVNECIRISKGTVIFGFVGKDYKPYKEDWCYYDNNIEFKNIIKRKNFGKQYHFIICKK